MTRHRPALLAVAALFGLGVLARAAFDAWHPPLDAGVYDRATVRALGPGAWLV